MEEITVEIERLGKHQNLTRSQERKYNQLSAEFEGLDTERRQLERNADIENLRNLYQSGQVKIERGVPGNGLGGFGDMSSANGSVRDKALRAIERVQGCPDDAKHRAFKVLDTAKGAELSSFARWAVVASDAHYERAMAKIFRDPVNGHREWSDEELRAFQQVQEYRAMSLGSDTAGGYLVPFTLDPSIILTNSGTSNPLRLISRVETTATDSWNGVTSAGVVAHWDAENVETTDDSPTLGQPSIPVRKATAFVAASLEVTMDSDLGRQLAGVFVDAFDNIEGQAFTTGSGSGQPKGVVTAVNAVSGSVITDATNAIAASQAFNMQSVLPARWRPRAQWMANLSIMNMFRLLPQAAGLNYPMVDDSTYPPKMLGWNFRENSHMDGTLGAGADNVLLAGDFTQFCIVDRVGTTVEFIPHIFGSNGRPTGTRGWYAYKRTGSDVLVPDAFRLLNLNG
ncbi:phage major capsid protein [Streptosporangium jomthongense]|uniref:Phage major capsid protein n=1 Tax=Streptosporangium jomthongense TaxID=1193683 RepID=A0ABV8F489_9ACTN